MTQRNHVTARPGPSAAAWETAGVASSLAHVMVVAGTRREWAELSADRAGAGWPTSSATSWPMPAVPG